MRSTLYLYLICLTISLLSPAIIDESKIKTTSRLIFSGGNNRVYKLYLYRISRLIAQ
ncbi:hypothetical protein MNBD_NITROSPINAE04-649 [hydrothermal vent metagenome]|uniref:Uncharacterized protein n=1 Tax=hydrothermal vent metagenome TaxID=652676 RepID=A0A3B1C4X8_9ZZZZ